MDYIFCCEDNSCNNNSYEGELIMLKFIQNIEIL